MIKSILYVIAITFICSYTSFKVLQGMNHNVLLERVSYYNIFIPYETQEKTYSAEDAEVNYFVEGFTNQDLVHLRRNVLICTAIAFLASIYPSYLLSKKNSDPFPPDENA